MTRGRGFLDGENTVETNLKRSQKNPGHIYYGDKDVEYSGSSMSGQARELLTGVSDEDRDRQRRLMNEQIQAYKTETELTKQELAKKKDEQIAEKRRIEEKQIRALRRSYRTQGFLGTQTSGEKDMSTKLGG